MKSLFPKRLIINFVFLRKLQKMILKQFLKNILLLLLSRTHKNIPFHNMKHSQINGFYLRCYVGLFKLKKVDVRHFGTKHYSIFFIM